MRHAVFVLACALVVASVLAPAQGGSVQQSGVPYRNTKTGLVNNSANNVFTISWPAGTGGACFFRYVCIIKNATDIQTEVGQIECPLTNKAGTVVGNPCYLNTLRLDKSTAGGATPQQLTAGTLTTTLSGTTTSSSFTFTFNPNSSLSSITDEEISYEIWVVPDSQTAVVALTPD